MSTKIVAARLATSAGVTTVITRSSNPGNIANIIRYLQPTSSPPGKVIVSADSLSDAFPTRVTAELNVEDKIYFTTVKKIYPQIKDGQFRVDFVFGDSQPPNLYRGQTVQMRLQLGENIPARLIPSGSFFQDTGGNWIFVVSKDQKIALRRAVKLGRRNNSFIEVLDGLDIGEKVVISAYTRYTDIDKLTIN